MLTTRTAMPSAVGCSVAALHSDTSLPVPIRISVRALLPKRQIHKRHARGQRPEKIWFGRASAALDGLGPHPMPLQHDFGNGSPS